MQQRHPGFGGRVVGGALEYHRVLHDRLVVFGRHDPGRAALELAAFKHLRERDKAQLGVAGGDEGVGLADALARHQLGLQGGGQTQLFHRLHGGGAVRGQLGVGNRQLVELSALEHGALVIDDAGLGRPQHQLARGVGKARAGHGVAFLLQLQRALVVGRQEHVEGRAVLDLGVERAGGAEGQLGLVPGGLGQHLGQCLGRCGEVGGHGDLHGLGVGGG